MTYTATYSPDDNKLRLYSVSRLDADTYARVKAAGFKWAPAQGLFVAPMWTPEREDLLLELAGEIGDEDTTLTDRAEQRAERFDGYSENRARDAESARKAVAAIADNIPFGQPILVGHHSERHARRDAEKIENGMRRAVRMWETSKYWTDRAAGALAHAKYKERPDVRARRIKGLESELRKLERSDKQSAAGLAAWAWVDKPEKWKPRADGTMPTREQRAYYIAERVRAYVARSADGSRFWSAYDVLRPEEEGRYKDAPRMTVDEVIAAVKRGEERAQASRARWRAHYENRLAYERAMLAEAGGTVADRKPLEVGGAVQCPPWGPRGGWAYVVKVNRVTVTVRHTWNQGGRTFRHNEPISDLRGIMTRAEVEAARADGRLHEVSDGTGFLLMHEAPKPTPKADEKPQGAADFEAMRESLRAGVQVVSAPQLFPTPADLAARMVDLADIRPGMRVLEPSAGTGAILGAINGRAKDCAVVAVEVNAALGGRLDATHCAVVVGDFLRCQAETLSGAFDRVLMNPPFENASDIKHIQHALSMVKPGGRLVAICANGPRQREQLMPLASSWEDLPEGTFAGTGVRTALLTIDA